MNREIKFRVWDKKENLFVNKKEGCDLSNIVYLDNNGIIDTSDDDYIFQQFTGLLDKSGVEIYEGDIVKGRDYKNNEYPLLGEVKYNMYTMKFDIKKINNKCCDGNESPISSMKVVGNIFENLELLNNSHNNE